LDDRPSGLADLDLDLIDEPDTELRFGYDPVTLHELAQDISARGLLQPIGVKHIPATGRYRRLWGGRRLAAHRLLGRTTIRAIIVEPNAPELDAGVSENLHRADLSPVEEAQAIQAALSAGYTADTVALRWHKSTQWVRDRLELLDWPHDLLDHLHRGHLKLSVAQWLRRVDNDSYRQYLTDSAITGGATATVVRGWVAEYEAQRPRIIANQATIEDLKARPRDFRVMIPCDACDEATEIRDLRTYRVCPRCDAAIRATAAEPSQPARP
jgi:ParB/RepB/Spo0J family partition protein